jgi:hypothetical protein
VARAGSGVAEAAVEADVFKDQGGSVISASGRECTDTLSMVHVHICGAGRQCADLLWPGFEHQVE